MRRLNPWRSSHFCRGSFASNSPRLLIRPTGTPEPVVRPHRMRLLAISDIHNRLECVEELRRREQSEYDALLVAGDIGVDKAGPIFSVLGSFGCPVLYIRGNWDFRMRADAVFGPSVHDISIEPFRAGGWCFAGLSYPEDSAQASADRARLAHQVSMLPRERTIVMSHARLARAESDLYGVPLFLYGHQHRFEDRLYRGARFVNVSALGIATTMTDLQGHDRNALRGSYVVIDLADERIGVLPKSFHQDTTGYSPAPSQRPSAPTLDRPFVDGSSSGDEERVG